MRALVERGQSPAKAERALSSEQKVSDARRLSFRAFAQRWVDDTLFYGLRARDAGGARRDGEVDCPKGAAGHDAFIKPKGDADADGTGNGTVGRSNERASSPPDGLGGWPLKSRQA